MNGKNALMNTIVLAILLLSVMLPLVTFVRAAESIETDKPLYAIIWKNTALGYVNVTVTLTGLSPETRYEVAVYKFHGPAGLNYIREVYGASEATIKFTIPPTMDSRPEDIAGTWNATLYKVVGETRTVVTWVNFGIWAINSKVLNYGRILQIWGGGFEPDTKVSFTIYDPVTGNIITDELFGEDPAKSPVSGVVCAKYGTFSNTSSIITTDIPETTYVVELVNYLFLPKISPGVPETTLEFSITHELIVKILSPEDGSEWRRTETIPVEVEVLYQDLVPVTAGEVNVTFTPPQCPTAMPPYDSPKTISLSYSPVSKTWIGSFKIQKDNSTGGDWVTPENWTVSAEAGDFYGNSGSDSVEIIVKAAILVVETVTAPPASVPRASWVSWVIRVKFKGDGLPATLYLPMCTVYVVNATTEAIVGSAYLTKIDTGIYNVTWWVPADAPLGEYKFLISPNALYDNVTICDTRNRGPEAKVLSPSFVVGVTALDVVVKTYGDKYDVTTEKVAFTPGSMVYIGARITYVDSGVTMTAGTVRAYIYNETDGLIDEIPMTFHSTTRMWWGEWDSDDYPAGRYTVIVKARDIGYNVGEGSTYFYISGLIISPVKGTVPPIEYTRCENLTKAMDVWLVTASVFTDPASGKSLGTEITIRGVHMTPNSRVNVTVDWLPYPEIAAGETILLAMNLPTDAEGNFATTIVFPTTMMGTYKITATDAKGSIMEAEFEVIPGMILTPDPVVGSALIKVIATGLPGESSSIDLLVNDTDAMALLAFQSMERWRADANGTLQSGPWYWYPVTYTVKPGFVIPFTEPGTYAFDLYLYNGLFYNCTTGKKEPVTDVTVVSDSVKVVNAFKEFTLIVDKIDALASLISSMNDVLVRVDGNVATLLSDTGAIKTSVSNLAKALSDLNAIVTDVKDGVAKIKTDVGDIEISVGDLKSLLNSVGGKVDSISGDIATIKTDVGAIKAKVDVLDAISSKVDTATSAAEDAASAAEGAAGAVAGLTTAVWIAVVLSLIAAIASIVAIIQVSRKIAG
jgi:methyl-accepting chemotaxis protein